LRRQLPPRAGAKCDDAEVCIFLFCAFSRADIVRNAFVRRRTCDKLTLEIPAMDPMAFGQLAISLFSLREAVVRTAVTLASGASHSNASGQI
jgi:hypothetical protein